MKSAPRSRRAFHLNLAAFKADYGNIQLVFRQGVVPLLLNAGEARIRGFEAEASCHPFETGLYIDASMSILEDEILSITEVPGVTATVQSGDELPLTESSQGNASLGTLGYAEKIYARPQNWYLQVSAAF